VDELDPALAATIAAIPAWNGLDPEVTPITIGITNRNFRVDIGGESFVVRLSGKDTDLLGIDRAAENEAASAAARAGVAPEVFAYLPERSARRLARLHEGATRRVVRRGVLEQPGLVTGATPRRCPHRNCHGLAARPL